MRYLTLIFSSLIAINCFANTSDNTFIYQAENVNNAAIKSGNNANINQSSLDNEAYNQAVDLINNQLKPTTKMYSDANNIKAKSQHIVKSTIDKLAHKEMAENSGKLYYFISFSMPMKMIKGYIREAIWSGGTIVFKGILPSYDNLHKFIFEKIAPLVNYAGIHPPVEIDPNKFEEYSIKSVPATVYTNASFMVGCYGKRQDNGAVICNPVNPDSYWKITGNVSTYYALNQFIDNGANAQFILNRYEKMTGIDTDIMIHGYTGKLQDLPQPLPKSYVNDLLSDMGLMQGTNGVIGKPQLIKIFDQQDQLKAVNSNEILRVHT